MPPHTPRDRRSFESPEFGATTPAGRPGRAKDRPVSVSAMVFAALLLAAIVAVIVLL